MGFSYDFYNRLKQSKMFLANPQKNYIGTINGAEDVQITKCFSNMFDFEFTIYESKNGETTEYYDKIVKHRLIEVQYIGWFQIVSASETQDEKSLSIYKTVKCCQLENTLVYRKIYDVSGTYALYNPTNTSESLLHIICAECGWSIGTISASLLGLYRTFDIDSMQIYNLLTTEIMDSFDCVITFDSYNRTISARKLSEIGEDTNIIISKKNILKSWIKSDTDSMIITKIRVKGGDNGLGGNVDIRRINLGSPDLINLDYFMNEDWCSAGLIAGYNNYLTAKSSASVSYSTSLSLLQTKQDELLTLNTDLTDLTSNQKAQSLVMGACVESFSPSRVPVSTDANYSSYQNALNLYNQYTTQIASKNSEIVSKNAEITALNTTLDNIIASVNISNYLTSEQITEMNLFITEDEEFSDSTYIITDTMTESEIIDMQKELMQSALNKLAIISNPQFVFTIKTNNLFTLRDNKDSLISYHDFIEKFDVGNIITIKYKDNLSMQARLMKMTVPFNSEETDIDLTFSSKSRLDDELIQLAEIIADSGRTANSFSLSKYGYNKASSITSDVSNFMNSTFVATKNAISNNANQEFYLDDYGAHMKKWLPDQNKYSDYASWWNSNILLFTDDGWATSKAGIGLFVNENNETFYGVLADIICGRLLMSEKLYIENSSGTYTFDDNGFISSSTINTNTYSVAIKPNSPANIFNISVNSISKLYIDTLTNKLVFSGELVGASGTFSGTVSAAIITGSAITGGSININNAFTVNSAGVLTCTGATVGGVINATGGNFSGNITSTATITGGTFTTTNTSLGRSTSIHDGIIESNYISLITISPNATTILYPNKVYLEDSSYQLTITASGITRYVPSLYRTDTFLTSNNYSSYITSVSYAATAGSATTANSASSAGLASSASTLTNGSRYAYVSGNDNLIGSFPSVMYVGSSGNPWAGGYGVNDWIATSDERKKYDFTTPDDRYLQFAKKLIPQLFKMSQGQSGRLHLGYTAQHVKKIMDECGILDTEFAGWIASPIYSKMILDKNGNETDTYDITSEISGYNYGLRYDEVQMLDRIMIADLYRIVEEILLKIS